MSSESERSLSLDELRQRNMPLPVQSAPPPEQHPTAEEWDELLEILSALYRLTAAQYDFLRHMNNSSLKGGNYWKREEMIADWSSTSETIARS